MVSVNVPEMQRLKKWQWHLISVKTTIKQQVILCLMRQSTLLNLYLDIQVSLFLRIKLLLVGMPFLMNLVSTKMVSLKILLLMKSLHPSWLGLRKAHFHLVNCQVAMPLLKN